MSKRLGNDYMVWLETVTPGTYTLIAGQAGCSINRSVSKIDTSSKDDLGYATSAFGLRDLSVDLMVKPKLPDALGYTRLETLALASPPAAFNIQIRKNGVSAVTGDAVLQVSVYGNIDTSSYDQNSTASVKITFTAAAAPTIDVLT